MPNSNKYFSDGFKTVVSILLQKSVQWNHSCCVPQHPVLHQRGAAEVLGCLTLVFRGGRQKQWLCLFSHWGIVHGCTSLLTRKWQQRSLLWQIQSPADKLSKGRESHQRPDNWELLRACNSVLNCCWVDEQNQSLHMEPFLLLLPLPRGKETCLSPSCRLATRSFRWSLEFELQAQLIPSNPMAMPGGDPGRKGESESSGTLHFLCVSSLQLLREGQKKKKAPIQSLL